MKLLRYSVFCVVIVLLAGCTLGEESKPADLILVNARVYTMDWDDPAPDGTLSTDAPHDERQWHPDADAIVVTGGDITFVGSTADARQYQAESTRLVDLAGATGLPGLVDSHTHVFELGAALERIDLIDIATEEEAIALVVERAKTVPKGEWIVGRGWDEGAWANRYPDKALLTQAVPDHPVFLDSLHSFGGWANQMALDIAGITAETEVSVGGEMRLGSDGQPNGLFLNNGVNLI